MPYGKKLFWFKKQKAQNSKIEWEKEWQRHRHDKMKNSFSFFLVIFLSSYYINTKFGLFLKFCGRLGW